MIHVEQLSKRFGAVEALRGVDFRAEDGRITGLLGHNGAGKSTTLRILSTVLRADGGRAGIDGFDCAAAPLHVRRSLGILPHASGLYAHLTGRENILYYARLHGMPAAEAACAADQLIERLALRQTASRRARGYSQGERLKIALARARSCTGRRRSSSMSPPTAWM